MTPIRRAPSSNNAFSLSTVHRRHSTTIQFEAFLDLLALPLSVQRELHLGAKPPLYDIHTIF